MVAVHRARLHKFVETMTRAGNHQNRGVVRAAGAASEAKTRTGNTAPIMKVAWLPFYDLGMPVVRGRPGRLSGSQENFPDGHFVLFSFDQAMSVLTLDRSGLCASSPPRLLAPSPPCASRRRHH